MSLIGMGRAALSETCHNQSEETVYICLAFLQCAFSTFDLTLCDEPNRMRLAIIIRRKVAEHQNAYYRDKNFVS